MLLPKYSTWSADSFLSRGSASKFGEDQAFRKAAAICSATFFDAAVTGCAARSVSGLSGPARATTRGPAGRFGGRGARVSVGDASAAWFVSVGGREGTGGGGKGRGATGRGATEAGGGGGGAILGGATGGGWATATSVAGPSCGA